MEKCLLAREESAPLNENMFGEEQGSRSIVITYIIFLKKKHLVKKSSMMTSRPCIWRGWGNRIVGDGAADMLEMKFLAKGQEEHQGTLSQW